MTELKNILHEMRTVLETVFTGFVVEWSQFPKEKLSRFARLSDELLCELQTARKSEESADIWWKLLQAYFQSYIELTGDLESDIERITETELWASWRTGFSEKVKSLPETVQLPLEKDQLAPHPDDRFLVKLWKWGKQGEIRVKRLVRSVINRGSMLFGKQQLFAPSHERRFHLHKFLGTTIELAVAEYILKEWQRFQKLVAGILYQLHERSEQLKNDSLFSQEDNSVQQVKSSEDLYRFGDIVTEHIKFIASCLKDLENSREEVIKRFEGFWQQVQDKTARNWQFAGTLILPERQFNTRESDHRWRELERKFHEAKNAWIRYFRGIEEEWHKDLELTMLQLKAVQLDIETRKNLDLKTKQEIIPVFSRSIDTVTLSLQKIRSFKSKTKEELERTIIQENRSLLPVMREERLPAMLDALYQIRIVELLEKHIQELTEALDVVSDQHTIFRHEDLQDLFPESKSETAPLKELVLEETFPVLNSRHNELRDSLRMKLEELRRTIPEIDQMIEFNLEASLNLLKQNDGKDTGEEARAVAIDGLERITNHLEELMKKSQDIIANGAKALQQITNDFTGSIQELLDSEKILELKLRLARAKFKERFRDYFDKFLHKVRGALPLILGAIVSMGRLFKSRYRQFRRITGLAAPPLNIEQELTLFLTETTRQIESLPYVYRQLFRREPLEDGRFFVGRRNEIMVLKDQLALWNDGQYAVTALVGEKGSGRTSLMNFAANEIYRKYKIKKLDLKRTITSEDELFTELRNIFECEDVEDQGALEAKLMTEKTGRVVILEDIQNLFLRTVDGFDLLQRFLLFALHTNPKVHWVLTCTLYSWLYLDKVIKISSMVQKVIFMGNLQRDEIENVIMKRHRVSGFELVFDVSETLMTSRKYKKLGSYEEQQNFLRTAFFEELSELSSGNLSVAILFWHRAIRQLERGRVTIRPLIDFDYKFLNQLPSNELFTLSALLQHEVLTVQQHHYIFYGSVRDSEMVLNRMKNLGILTEAPQGYRIHPFLYRPIVNALRSKNILH